MAGCLLAMPRPSAAENAVVVTREVGPGRHLAASLDPSGNLRVFHRAPGGGHEPGEHLHIRLVQKDGTSDMVRGLPPRSPRTRSRQSAEQILVSVPAEKRRSLREIMVTSVPLPHSKCTASVGRPEIEKDQKTWTR